jgi:hypothetical protein
VTTPIVADTLGANSCGVRISTIAETTASPKSKLLQAFHKLERVQLTATTHGAFVISGSWLSLSKPRRSSCLNSRPSRSFADIVMIHDEKSCKVDILPDGGRRNSKSR